MAASANQNQHFAQLLNSGRPVGEVTRVDKFIIELKGLQPCSIHSLVMFEDGSKGFVYRINPKSTIVLHLANKPLKPGMVAVVQYDELVCKVGEEFIGRVVNVSGQPLDDGKPIAAGATWPIFNLAPPLNARAPLDTQITSGVTLIDTLFPLVKGQRIVILGDSKSGKQTLATQLALNQKNSDTVVIFSLVARRHSDIDAILSLLTKNDVLKNSIVLVSTTFDPLVSSYLNPYVAASLGEYLWQEKNRDVLIVYNDLTAHAQIYREISLIAGVNPGRDSYPGDIFYAHSSLLERSGKLARNGKTLTALPIVLASGGDITAYLPTNIMSITDGQWVLDMDIFREGLKPAINVGLSVSRVGGRGQSQKQHLLASTVAKAMAAYEAAKEFSHFGSELALGVKKDLSLGQQLLKFFTQLPGETYSPAAQQLMLEILLESENYDLIDITALKTNAPKIAERVTNEAEYDMAKSELQELSTMELKKT